MAAGEEGEIGGTSAVEGGGAPTVDIPTIIEPVAAPEPAAAPVLHTDTPTLLEELGKEPAAVVAEVKPVEEAKSAADAEVEGKPAEAIVPEPATTFEKFALPDDVRLADERMGELSELLAKPRDQANAQAIVDFGIAEMRRYADHLGQEQHRVFAETRAGWRDQVKADEELGGAGFETAMASVGRMRDLLVPQKDAAAFAEFLRVTGAGDHPAFLRMVYRAARIFDEGRQAPAPASPVPDRGGRPRRGVGRGVLYDNPRSHTAE